MSDSAVGVYALIMLVGLIIALRDHEHGFFWRLFCFLGGWIPFGLWNHTLGLLTTPIPFWVWLFFPLGPIIYLIVMRRRAAHPVTP